MYGKMVCDNAWYHPTKAINVLCEDGKRRVVRLNQQADTWFSWSGRCTIYGKTQRGYVTSIESDDGKHDLEFHIYRGD